MRRLGLLLLLAGCSFINDPEDHREGGDLPPVAAEDFCGEVAMVVCDGHFRCCSAPTADPDTCEADAARRCTSRISEVLLDPRTGYSPSVAAVVAEEGAAYAADCDTELAQWTTARTGLLRVLRGTVDPGGECTPDGWLDVAAAYSCNDLAQSCASGGGGRSYCVDLGGSGDTCRQNDSCLSALHCEGFTPFVSEGTCQPRLALGDECDDGRECASTVCDEVCVPLGVEELYCALPDAL